MTDAPRVIVGSREGDRSPGIVVSVLEKRAQNHLLTEIDGCPTLLEVWDDQIDPEERVVRVRHADVDAEGDYHLSGSVYSYPESQVQLIGDEDLDALAATDSTDKPHPDAGGGSRA